MTLAAQALNDAAAAVEDRHKIYGPPHRNFKRIAGLMSVYLTGKYAIKIVLDCADVVNLAILTKMGRLQETPDHLDSWVDIAGYAGCGAEVTVKSVGQVEASEEVDPRSKMIWRLLQNECDHVGYKFKDHGRRCPRCGTSMLDWGD